MTMADFIGPYGEHALKLTLGILELVSCLFDLDCVHVPSYGYWVWRHYHTQARQLVNWGLAIGAGLKLNQIYIDDQDRIQTLTWII